MRDQGRKVDADCRGDRDQRGAQAGPRSPRGRRLEGQNLGLLSRGWSGVRCVGWAVVTPRCGFLPGQHPAQRLRLGQSPHSLQVLLVARPGQEALWSRTVTCYKGAV